VKRRKRNGRCSHFLTCASAIFVTPSLEPPSYITTLLSSVRMSRDNSGGTQTRIYQDSCIVIALSLWKGATGYCRQSWLHTVCPCSASPPLISRIVVILSLCRHIVIVKKALLAATVGNLGCIQFAHVQLRFHTHISYRRNRFPAPLAFHGCPTTKRMLSC
jgi:hypothetical protein